MRRQTFRTEATCNAVLLAMLSLFSTAAVAMAAPKKAPEKTADFAAQARDHFARGHYEEALECWQKAADGKADPVTVALGRSQVLQAIGNWESSQKTIETTQAKQPGEPRLLARLAELQFLRGKYREAEMLAEKTLSLDRENLTARLVLADVCTETGRVKEANERYRWFIHFYNDRQPEDAVRLLLVARGSIEYARRNHNSQIYHFVVNTLYPDALKNDPTSWEAHYGSGSLLLEKFNREQALPELEQALALNPRAAEVLVAIGQDALDQYDLDKAAIKAQSALEINPRLPAALRLKSDVEFLRGHTAEAERAAAKALEISPHDQRSLARVAACQLVQDRLPDPNDLLSLLVEKTATRAKTGQAKRIAGRFRKLWDALIDFNDKPAQFLIDLGKLLEARRQYDVAEVCYRRAIAVNSQIPESHALLGLLLMRVGKTEEAHKVLDAALKADPYHARISNFRKVLKVLDRYGVITTEHFVIRFDAKLDRLLGTYMADYLESIFPELVKQFGFEPPQRTQFEIFNKAEGTSGHEWFSARMVGLPWIQTIGASTGVMVAMTSPTASSPPFNWARVVRHEFVHVITVQQTHYNIPHWFTEALAVLNEGYPPPASWSKIAAERAVKNELRTLETIDQGFQRPANSDDWQFAYSQSRLYAEYMVERQGPDALKRMLGAYGRGLDTCAAIHEVFAVNQSEFERGFAAFVKKRVAHVAIPPQTAKKSLEQLEQESQAKPNDAVLAGEYAWSLLQAGKTGLARKAASEALAKNPRQIRAALVLARLESDDQQFHSAAGRLEPLLDPKSPDREVLLMLAKLKLLDDKPREAAALCERGRAEFPEETEFEQGLAAASAQLDDSARLSASLIRLCQMFPDDPVPRKRLLELAYRDKRWRDAIRWGKESLYVDLLDAETHRELGEAYLALHDTTRAVAELEGADELKPNDGSIEVALAKALSSAGRKGDAKARLEAVLKRDAQNTEARRALAALNQ